MSKIFSAKLKSRMSLTQIVQNDNNSEFRKKLMDKGTFVYARHFIQPSFFGRMMGEKPSYFLHLAKVHENSTDLVDIEVSQSYYDRLSSVNSYEPGPE